MKNLTTLIIIIILNSFALNAQEFQLNPNKSSLEWTGKAAFNSYALTGSLETANGSIQIKNDTITALSILVDMKSLDHENNDLKKHLRSVDFFEVKKYKQANFYLDTPCKIENGQARISGKMTIKGIAKAEVIKAEITTNNNTITIIFETPLDRTAYGIKHNSPSFFKSLKENAIADEFLLKGTLKFN